MTQPPGDTPEERDAELIGNLTTLRLELAVVACEAREQQGLTQAAAAERAGVSLETLRKIETTSVGSVPLETTYEYLYRLGISLHLVASDGENTVLLTDDENVPAELKALTATEDETHTFEAGWEAARARAVSLATLYDILVTHAGANPSGLAQFMTVQLASDQPLPEYRFQGSLGSGGKLNYDPNRGFSVSCYSEDATAERERIIFTTNGVLRKNGFNKDPRYAP